MKKVLTVLLVVFLFTATSAFAVLPIVEEGCRGTILVDGGVVGGEDRPQAGTESFYFVQNLDDTLEIELDFFQDNYGAENWPVGYITLRGLNNQVLPYNLIPVGGAKIDSDLYPNAGVERLLDLRGGDFAVVYVRNYFDISSNDGSFLDCGIDIYSTLLNGRVYTTPGIGYIHAWGDGSGVVIPRSSIGYVLNKSVSVYVDSSIALSGASPLARITGGLKFNY